MYSFEPTSRQLALQEEIRSFVEEHLLVVGEEQARVMPFNRDRWQRCGRIGLPGLSIPEAYGGRGLSALDTFLCLETLGYANPDNGLNFSLCAHLLACVTPLWLFGSESLRQRYLPGLCDGTWIAANAMTEPGSGSDAFRMTTLAEVSGSVYHIRGAKSFVSNGPVADGILLYAATDPGRGHMGGITAFWLDKNLHTYSSSPPLEKGGLQSSALGTLYFENTVVEKEFRVGPEGRGALYFNRSMEWERICLGAAHLGNMKRLLEQAVSLIRVHPSTKYGQAEAHALADLRARYEAVRLLALAAAWKMDQGKPTGTEAAMAKLQMSELYKSACLKIASFFLARGLHLSDADLSHQDAISSTIYSGTSEMQRTIISQAMGL
jgi:alkylation response protein AidB-like acyl-CoA dehydrogenase